MILGSVTWMHDGVENTVTLDEHGKWSCPAAPWAADLCATLFDRDLTDYSPADGVYGAGVLRKAAKELGGTSWYRPVPQAPPGIQF